MSSKADVLIVGGGWAGLAAALTVAKGGGHPVVLDRAASIGPSSPQGGVASLREIAKLPGDLARLPADRVLSAHRLSLLTPKATVSVDVQDETWSRAGDHLGTFLSVTGLPWLAQRAIAAGAEVRSGTKVEGLALDPNGRVTGVRTAEGTVAAPVTILAAGMGCSFTNAPPLGSTVAYALPQEAVALELYHLGAGRVDARFPGPGGTSTIMSAVLAFQAPEVPAWGWVRPGREHVQLSVHVRGPVGANAESAARAAMAKFRDHPAIAPVLRGATKVAEGAQRISELDSARSKLCGDGVLVAGGTAGLAYSTGVRSVGVALALRSGVLAGDVALRSMKAHDPSARVLGMYADRLHEARILATVLTGAKKARRFAWNKRLHSRYPAMAQDIFHAMMTENGQPKVHGQEHMNEARRKAGLGYMTVLRDGWAANRWP